MRRSKRSDTADVGGAAQTGADLERMQSGFDPMNWNAAIGLQCAVRDSIERPVTLEQACRLMTALARALPAKQYASVVKEMQKLFDYEKAERDRVKAAQREKELASTRRSNFVET